MAGGTLNLNIEISAIPGGLLRVTLRSPVGDATADLPPPFADAEIARYLAAFSGASSGGARSAEVANLARELGDRLFAFLFTSNNAFNAVYIASLERAANAGNALRLRVSAENAGTLALLPLETLRDPVRDVLALSRQTPLVRAPQGIALRTPPRPARPLRVLAILSSPADLPALDLEGEWARLQEATAQARTSGLLILERLARPTLTDLRRQLRAAEYHIIHFVGHSDLDPVTGGGALVFGRDDEPTLHGTIVSGIALGRELGEETTTRLIVLNSCHSARRPERDALDGIASGLIARGIPAVVGMQFAIPDDAGKIFAEEFYRALADGVPIDAAMSEARRALAALPSRADWLIPALYLRAESGQLFDPAPERPSTEAAPPRAVRPLPLLMGGALVLLVLVLLTGLLFALLRLPPVIPTPTPTQIVDPATLPDLVISGIRISPQRPPPGPGAFFRVNITVTNQGGGDSGAFTFRWDSSVSNPQQVNSFIGDVDNIPPGASRSVSFPYLYGWWGRFETQVEADIPARVSESDEFNNRRFLPITLSDIAFDIDFSLIPSAGEVPGVVVEPPLSVVPQTFSPWNLRFALETDDPACAGTLALVEGELEEDGFADILMTTLTDNPACAGLPLVITVGGTFPASRGLPGGAVADVLNETATVDLFGEDGTLLFSGTDAVEEGDTLILGSDLSELDEPGEAGGLLAVARIRIVPEGESVRLTRLTLLPPAP